MTFPQLTREDIHAWLAFAAERERRLASQLGSRLTIDGSDGATVSVRWAEEELHGGEPARRISELNAP